MKSAKETVESFKKLEILVAGDVMLDRYIRGSVDRISPESPVPVLAVKDEESALGGAGNVLANLHHLSIRTHMLSVIGQDEAGEHITAILQGYGTNLAGLIRTARRPTTIKTRFMSAGQHLLRVDSETKEPLDSELAKELFNHAEKLVPALNALIISDYCKGVITPDIAQKLIALAQAHNVPVLVDSKKTDYRCFSGAAVITPNRKELAAATNMKAQTDEEITQAARHIIDSCSIRAVAATRSEDGLSVIGKDDKEPCHFRTSADQVISVAGAGDTFLATLAAGIAAGAELKDATRTAQAAANFAITRPGTTLIRHAELATAIAAPPPEPFASGPEDGVFRSWDEAARKIEEWKDQGQRIGFTNGCFDILHRGHVSYLRQTRQHCDRLVVGLNADSSVRRLKGAGRPVNDEQARAIVLAALSSVDMVVIFGDSETEEDKAIALIRTLKPDTYFKGGDYTEDEVPETPTVRSYGGKVMIMGQVEGYSTTATIAKTRS